MLGIEVTARLVAIVAVVRPGSLARTVQALAALEQLAFTRWRALGRGRQRGIRLEDPTVDPVTIEWLSKVVLSIVVPEDHAQPVVQAIIKANQTGAHGDGTIFVCPVAEEVSVRTGGRVAMVAET